MKKNSLTNAIIKQNLILQERINISWEPLAVLLIFFTVTGMPVYFNALSSYFLSDDFSLIGEVTENPAEAYHKVKKVGFLRPVIILSYFTDYKIWKFNAFGYHLTNLLFHVINSFFVSVLAMMLLKFFPGRNILTVKEFLISLLAGLFFLVLPCHSESVSWISGRTDVIATFFILISLISFCYYLMISSPWALAASVANFYVALYAKESAIPVLFIIILLTVIQKILYPEKITVSKIILIFALFVCAESAYFLHRYYALGTFIGGYGTERHMSFVPGAILEKFARFTIRALTSPLPCKYASLFSHKNLMLLGTAEIICFLISIGAMIFMVKSEKCQGLANNIRNDMFLLTVLFGCFVLSLLPVINLDVSLFDTQGERFLYFPSVFASMGAVCCIIFLIRLIPFWLPVLCFLIGFSALNLYQVNLGWKEAGKISGNITSSLARDADHTDVLIVNIPDNLKGAYIFRNGLWHYLNQFIKKITRVHIISAHDIHSPDDEFTLVMKQGDSNPHFFFSLSKKSRFYYVRENKHISFDKQESGKGFEFHLKSSGSEQFDIFFYDSGTLKKVHYKQVGLDHRLGHPAPAGLPNPAVGPDLAIRAGLAETMIKAHKCLSAPFQKRRPG